MQSISDKLFEMKNLPQARNENIVIQQTGGETLVYDLLTNKAYCLNETSAKVFEACGDNGTFEDLKSKHNLSDDLISLSLDELKKVNLLAGDHDSPFTGISRREVVRRIGLASMVALPVISSLVAPAAANAASSAGVLCTCSAPANQNARVEGCPCASNADCCGVCVSGGGNSSCSAPTVTAQPTANPCCPQIA